MVAFLSFSSTILLAGSIRRRTAASGHIGIAQNLLADVLKKGDTAIDATCGNGHDSAYLCSLCLDEDENSGNVYCIDVQQSAIEATRKKLTSIYGEERIRNRVNLICASHETFPPSIVEGSVSAIVYNLGYLPGTSSHGSNRVFTKTPTTLQSLNNALPLIKRGGLLLATSYRGHAGGVEEYEACRDFFTKLDYKKWRVYAHSPINGPKDAPEGAVVFSALRKP